MNKELRREKERRQLSRIGGERENGKEEKYIKDGFGNNNYLKGLNSNA